MTKRRLGSIYGKSILHSFKNDYLCLMLYDSAVDRDADRMNINLAEYAILNPLT